MSIEEQKAAQAVDVLEVMKRDAIAAGRQYQPYAEAAALRAESAEARAIVAKLIERDRTAGYTHEDVMRLVEAARLSQEFADGLHGMSRNNAEALASEVGDALIPALAPFTHQAKDGSR